MTEQNHKKLDLIYLGLFGLIVALPVAITLVSSFGLWEDARLLVALVCALPLGSGWLLHELIKRTGFDQIISEKLKLAAILIGVACWVNAGVHFVHGREIDSATKGRAERLEEEKQASEQARNLLTAQKDLIEADRKRLMQLPDNRRRSALPSLSLPTMTGQAKKASNDPDAIRDANMPLLWRCAILDICACVLAISYALWKYGQDSDGNGQADWQDRQDQARAIATPGGVPGKA